MEKFPIPNQEESREARREHIKRKLIRWVAVGIVSASAIGGWEKMEDYQAEPENYLKWVEKHQQLSPEEASKLREEVVYLESQYHTGQVLELRQEAHPHKKENAGRAEVKGFDKIGVDNKVFADIWNEDYYPKGTIADNIETVEMKVETKSMNAEYHLPKGSQRGGDTMDYSSYVTFYGHPGDYATAKDTAEALDWHFSHELGHRNDWNNNLRLSPSERVEFLYDITKAFNKSDRFHDPLRYVEEINNRDKKAEEYDKVKEWWATLCENYLTFSEDLRRDSPEDYALVEKWLTRMDPQFNPLQAKTKRDMIIERLVKGSRPAER